MKPSQMQAKCSPDAIVGLVLRWMRFKEGQSACHQTSLPSALARILSNPDARIGFRARRESC